MSKPRPTYLKPKDVVRILGVSEKTVYDLLNSGRLPALRIGRQWRIKEDDLAALEFRPRVADDPMPRPRPRPSRLNELIAKHEAAREARGAQTGDRE